jgi:tetratricopeptide (TPR) repeat protein
VESLHEIATLQAGGMRDPVLKRFEAYALYEQGDAGNAQEKMEELQEMIPQEQLTSMDLEYMGKIYHTLAGTDTAEAGPAENYDSLAAEMYLKAARMDRSKDQLFIEAVKIYAKAKMHDKAIAAVREKMAITGKVEANDWYYLGTSALKTKRWQLADSAWTKYIERQPAIHNGYLGRARANSGMDSLKTSWQAKPFYEEVVRKIKPEDQTKHKVDLEEAYFYLGFYYYTKEKDMGMASCFFQKMKDLNAGTSNTKTGTDMLLQKEIRDVTPKDCSVQ